MGEGRKDIEGFLQKYSTLREHIFRRFLISEYFYMDLKKIFVKRCKLTNFGADKRKLKNFKSRISGQDRIKHFHKMTQYIVYDPS